MKFKSMTTGILLSCLSSLAYGQDYACVAKANPDRGFNSGFEIQLSPAAIGGQMKILANGKQKILGIISETGSLSSSNSAQKPAFDMTLGLIAEADLSGIQEADLRKVSSINRFKVPAPDGDEILVFQIFAGNHQIGGTFMASGLGTACLPK